MKPADSTFQDLRGARFVFREVRTPDELQQSLKLRYFVYARDLGVKMLQSLDHPSGMDVDAYDLRAHHYVLLVMKPDGSERVGGTLRIVRNEPGPMERTLRGIAAEHPSVIERLLACPKTPLPMLSYLAQASAVEPIYRRFVDLGEAIAEPGRLCLHPELRVATAREGTRLSHFMITCAHAVAWHILGLDRVLMDCDVHLERFYRAFGFVPLAGGDAAWQPQLEIRFMVMQSAPAWLPPPFRKVVARLARQIVTQGRAELEAAHVAIATAARAEAVAA